MRDFYECLWVEVSALNDDWWQGFQQRKLSFIFHSCFTASWFYVTHLCGNNFFSCLKFAQGVRHKSYYNFFNENIKCPTKFCYAQRSMPIASLKCAFLLFYAIYNVLPLIHTYVEWMNLFHRFYSTKYCIKIRNKK